VDNSEITYISLCAGYGGIDFGLRRCIPRMTKKQHSALTIGLSYGLNETCRSLHHSKSERHEYGAACPAEARHKREMNAAYQALKELNTELNTKLPTKTEEEEE